MIDRQRNLKNMELIDIEDMCKALGEKKYRAKQIFEWLYRGIESIDQMANIPDYFRQELKDSCYISKISIETKLKSHIDETIKYLLRLEDNNIVESVLMKYKYGISACLSTQVGCRMGCNFCASAIGGKVRNLSAAEMVDEIMALQKDSAERISNIVLMGTGEPLDNFENVIKFLNIINSPSGLNIGMRHITLSTCGLVPEIIKLASYKFQITLAISLHAPNDDIRKKLMPIANKYSIQEIIEACEKYINVTRRRITFEYSLIRGVNDSNDNALELADLLKGLLCHVNLIPINEIAERNYKKSIEENVQKFKTVLSQKGIETTIRRELGADINAACGQLRKDYKNDSIII